MSSEIISKTNQTDTNSSVKQKLPNAAYFRSNKTYGHESGFSCCFRQWRASHSHCRFIHGYALSFSFTFIAKSLDKQGWVMDFGGLKPIKKWLQENFDHQILIAADDPELRYFQDMQQKDLCSIKILPHVGCEAFAYYVWQHCDDLIQELTKGRVHIETVSVREHGGNGALFTAENFIN